MEREILPKEWREVKLGEVCTFHKGKGLSKKEIKKDGKYPCILYGELFTKYSSRIKNVISRTDNIEGKFFSNKEDILMPSSDVTPNGLATASVLYKDGIILGGDIIVIRCTENQMDGHFFCLYVSANKHSVLKLVSGTTVFHIYKSDLATFKIVLPPLSEQKKIAAVLSKIQQSIDTKEELIKTTKELKKSMIQCFFAYGTKNEKTKQTEIGEIPKSWNIIKIKATGRIVTGSTPSTKNKNFYGGEYNLISPADLDSGKYVQSAHKKLTKAGYQTCTPIPQNSILVGCIGNIGKLGMVNNNYSTTNQQINSIIVNSSHNPDFVYYMLQNCRQRLSQSAAKVTVPILNKKNFENFKIAIPSKISEQNKIASILSKIDERIQNYENQKSALQSLFKSMLNKLMTGQIRVHKLDIDVSEVE